MGDKNLKVIFEDYRLVGINRYNYSELGSHTYIMQVESMKEGLVLGMAIEVVPEALDLYWWNCTDEELSRWKAEADLAAVDQDTLIPATD